MISLYREKREKATDQRGAEILRAGEFAQRGIVSNSSSLCRSFRRRRREEGRIPHTVLISNKNPPVRGRGRGV